MLKTAEDETVIIGHIQWDYVVNDDSWGWCGRSGANHECEPAFVHVVGDDDDAYGRLIEAYRTYKVGGFAWVIMLNPVHQYFPPIGRLQ